MIHKTRLTITLNSQTALLALLMTLILSAPLDLVSETMTMTATYPSPVGIYRSLITTGGTSVIGANTLLARDGGKVGIGTANPGAKLDVNGNANVTGDISANGTGNIRAIGAISGASAAIGSGGMTVNGPTSYPPQKDYVLTALDTNGTAAWRPAAGGGASIITCSGQTTATNGMFFIPFTASSCGGTLPDSTYSGALKSLSVCGYAGRAGVLNNGEAAPSYIGSGSGPAVYIDAGYGGQNPCDTKASAAAIYIKSGSGTATSGGGPGTGGPGTGGSGLVSGGLYGSCVQTEPAGQPCSNPRAPAICTSSNLSCACPSQYSLVATGQGPIRVGAVGSPWSGSTITTTYYSCMKN